MYDNFVYDYQKKKLAGYIWDVAHPRAVLCIIHGIGEYAGRYDRMAQILNENAIAVLSMDLPGHGLSQGTRGHLGDRKELLEMITLMINRGTETYRNIPLVLYGHSMGGNICLDYRERGPKNDVPVKYIVSGPWLKLVRDIPGPVYALAKKASRFLPEFQIGSGCKPEDLGNFEIIKTYATDPLVHTHITISTAGDCIDIANGLLDGSLESNGKALDKPFLLMHGSDDKICDVEGSRLLAKKNENNPNFRYIEWPGYYHEIHNGGPDATGEEVIDTIKNFILS